MLARWIFFGVASLSVYPKKLPSANITALNGDNVLVVTEGEDTIEHYEISYFVLNLVAYVCVC